MGSATAQIRRPSQKTSFDCNSGSSYLHPLQMPVVSGQDCPMLIAIPPVAVHNIMRIFHARLYAAFHASTFRKGFIACVFSLFIRIFFFNFLKKLSMLIISHCCIFECFKSLSYCSINLSHSFIRAVK